MNHDLGILIAPAAENVLVFCTECNEPIQRGIRIIRYNSDLRMFDEVGVFHPQCAEDLEPIRLLERAEFHFIPAIFLRSAM